MNDLLVSFVNKVEIRAKEGTLDDVESVTRMLVTLIEQTDVSSKTIANTLSSLRSMQRLDVCFFESGGMKALLSLGKRASGEMMIEIGDNIFGLFLFALRHCMGPSSVLKSLEVDPCLSAGLVRILLCSKSWETLAECLQILPAMFWQDPVSDRKSLTLNWPTVQAFHEQPHCRMECTTMPNAGAWILMMGFEVIQCYEQGQLFSLDFMQLCSLARDLMMLYTTECVPCHATMAVAYAISRSIAGMLCERSEIEDHIFQFGRDLLGNFYVECARRVECLWPMPSSILHGVRSCISCSPIVPLCIGEEGFSMEQVDCLLWIDSALRPVLFRDASFCNHFCDAFIERFRPTSRSIIVVNQAWVLRLHEIVSRHDEDGTLCQLQPSFWSAFGLVDRHASSVELGRQMITMWVLAHSHSWMYTSFVKNFSGVDAKMVTQFLCKMLMTPVQDLFHPLIIHGTDNTRDAVFFTLRLFFKVACTSDFVMRFVVDCAKHQFSESASRRQYAMELLEEYADSMPEEMREEARETIQTLTLKNLEDDCPMECPITMQAFNFPVTCSDGSTYELQALLTMLINSFNTNDGQAVLTSPLTRCDMSMHAIFTRSIVDCRAVRAPAMNVRRHCLSPRRRWRSRRLADDKAADQAS